MFKLNGYVEDIANRQQAQRKMVYSSDYNNVHSAKPTSAAYRVVLPCCLFMASFSSMIILSVIILQGVH